MFQLFMVIEEESEKERERENKQKDNSSYILQHLIPLVLYSTTWFLFGLSHSAMDAGLESPDIFLLHFPGLVLGLSRIN